MTIKLEKPIILNTNIETIPTGKSAKDHEISLGVLPSELFAADPTIYAFRQGMVYNPKNEFKPDVTGGHTLPEKLIISYYSLLDDARNNLIELRKQFNDKKDTGSSNGSSAKVEELLKDIKTKDDRIKEQTNIITKLKEQTKNGNAGNEVQQLKDMIQLLSDMNKNRIEVKIGDKIHVDDDIKHEKFNDIIKLTTKEQAAYLFGPAGTGKSRIAEQVAKVLGLDFYPASTITQEFKLTGFIDGNGRYHETNFYKAFVKGGLFFLDEMDSCISDVLVGINGALASGYFDFPTGTEKAHENFRVIAAGNTIGRGGNSEYTGRSVLDMSTLDRFWGVEINYSEKIDLSVSNNDVDLVQFAQAVRQAAQETGISILMSYRSISRIAGFQDIFTLEQIMDMAVIKGTAKDDILMLCENMNIDRTNKYYKAFKKAAA